MGRHGDEAAALTHALAEQGFTDRVAAGRALAETVARQAGHLCLDRRPLVLALPRGGVPVAARVAETIGADLDVLVVRKIGAPGRPEFGVGAIAEDGPVVFDAPALRGLGLTEDDLADTVRREHGELDRRVLRYRGNRPLPATAGRVVVVVDDGVATGVTARAALRWLRRRPARELLLASPVCAREADRALGGDADAVISLRRPIRFGAVGEWYADFTQLTDADVETALRAAQLSSSAT